ncbi:hypothetical protein [Nitrosomonas oligotropha]|uniref:Fibronectin type-III domain-containing protein n=1 Tax=Nitrosomonas oligotropha TaxID=42354 RepID=A0A1H8VM73_9PROT|nr:hypothetical protein [Nitrosomonas oligotropha]SDX62509.1 hypothetical protein SAMN05216300_1663 [Nitrosomonas oligotropha]SEP16501.1 hypothetical protein SAMN05216333_1673 [Nitrosomonas oligotropha]
MRIYQLALLTPGLLAPITKTAQIKQSSKNHMTRFSVTRTILFVLISALCFLAPVTHAANLLFKSNFGPGVSLGTPTGFYRNGAWQHILGADKETGFSWPIKALGADFSGIQMITIDPVDSTSVGEYITNEIRQVTGPKGNLVNELFQNVKIKGDLGQAGSQAPLLINRPWTIGDVNDLYITYWLKFPADFPSKLTRDVPGAGWRDMFAFKTGGYLNDWRGDYRVSIVILKGTDGQLYWQTKGDNVANGPWPRVDYWTIDNRTVAVPVGKWFKFEVYWHRSKGSDGRFWAAVDGKEIVDYFGPNMGGYNLPITRIIISNPYSAGYPTVESHSTGLEIWDGFPCGEGVSCSNFDTAAPSTPTSLTLKLYDYATAAGVGLSWSASSDAIAVAGYNIYRNGTKVGQSTTTSYRDVIYGSSTGSLYSYTVRAFDAAGNLSLPSPAALTTY